MSILCGFRRCSSCFSENPGYIAGDAEHIYFNDISGGHIYLVDSDGTYRNITGDLACKYLNFSQGTLTTVSDNSVLMISENGDCAQKGPIFVKSPVLYIPSYIALGCALTALCIVCGVLVAFLKQKGGRIRLSIFTKQVLTTVPIITVMVAISLNYVNGSVMNILLENMKDSVMGFNELNSDKFNGDEIETLAGYNNLNTDEFYRMHSTLQEILNNNRDSWNQSYYTAIYLLRGYDLYLLAISNDSSPNFSYYMTPLTRLFRSGRPIMKDRALSLPIPTLRATGCTHRRPSTIPKAKLSPCWKQARI